MRKNDKGYLGNYKKEMVIIIIIKKRYWAVPHSSPKRNVYNKKMLQAPSLRWMAAMYYNFSKIEKKRQGIYIGKL